MNNRNRQDSTVIVGASVAGMHVADALRRLGYLGRVTVIGSESWVPYDRPPLSKQFLAGEWGTERIELSTARRAKDLSIDLVLGVRATSLEAQRVVLESGRRISFSNIIIATGVSARQLPLQPCSDRVATLRTLDDAIRIRQALSKIRSIVIIGGGFIGAEVAGLARDLGIRVTILEAASTLFEQSLGRRVGKVYEDLHRSHGVNVVVNAKVVSITACAESVSVSVPNGTTYEADFALVGVGTRPNTEWLAECGFDGLDGVLCDSSGLVVGSENVYALGDVARWFNPLFGLSQRFEHWTNAVEQARTVADRIVGKALTPGLKYEGWQIPYFWSEQYGQRLQVVGMPTIADRVDLMRPSAREEINAAIYFRGDHIVGAMAVGSPLLLAKMRPLVAESASVGHAEALLSAELGMLHA